MTNYLELNRSKNFLDLLLCPYVVNTLIASGWSHGNCSRDSHHWR